MKRKIRKTTRNSGRPKGKKPVSGSRGALRSLLQRGLTLHRAGRLPEAEAFYRQLLTADPNHAEAWHYLGLLAYQAGKVGMGVELMRKALSIEPDNAEAHNNLGLALNAQGKLDEAVASYRQALALKPDFADAFYNLGIVLQEQGELGEAAVSYRQALTVKPDFAAAAYNLGIVLQEQGKLEEAIAGYRLAIDVEPDFVEAYNNLGVIFSKLGRMDEALACYRKALSLKPEAPGIYKNLSTITTFDATDDAIRAMEDLYRGAISGMERVELGFALGKAFEDLKDYDRAFGYLLEANRQKRKSFEYSIHSDEDFFERIKKTFSPDFFASRQAAGSQDETPIFVIGMPRSGTTLVEQILASHPQVFGAGELTALHSVLDNGCAKGPMRQFPECVLDLPIESLAGMGAAYVEKTRPLSPEAKRITDKMPDHFLRVGVIRAFLPHSRVVHCVRDPMANCFSIFKNDFSRKGTNKYAYDLSELGRYYRLYRNLMIYWEKVLPGFVYTIRYEDLIADQRGRTEDLLRFCGLPWDEACLAFYKTERTVETASLAQVRQPLYKASVALWRHYEQHLGPLKEAIHGHGDWDGHMGEI